MSRPPLTIRQNIGIGLLFGTLTSVPFLGWTFTVRAILTRRELDGFDFLNLGIIVILMAAAGVTWNRANRWAAIRTLPVDQRPSPPKPPSWIDQIRQSSRLAWAMIAYAAVSYLITMAGLIALILDCRERRWLTHEYLPAVLYALLAAWGIGVVALGRALFHWLTGRGGWTATPHARATSLASPLWDHDLDNHLAGESRQAS